DRSRCRVDSIAADARQWRHHQGVALGRAPQRRGQGKRPAGDGVDVAVIHGHAGNLTGTAGATGLR
ncbi:hypothetical protein CEE93_12560, partial [Lactobacillus crispatus]